MIADKAFDCDWIIKEMNKRKAKRLPERVERGFWIEPHQNKGLRCGYQNN